MYSVMIYIGCVYIPPLMNVQCYDHLKSVASACEMFKNVLVLGGYNLSQITWCQCDDYPGLLPGNVKSAKEVLLYDTFAFLGLAQNIDIRNNNDSILDLCFANFEIESIVKCHGLVGCDLYHPEPINNFYYDFHNTDYTLINNYFLSFDGLSIQVTDLETSVNNF